MKRTVVVFSALLAVAAAAFQPPARAPLPNFDQRTDGAGAVPDTIAPEHAAAVQSLQSRVPQLQVKRSKVLNAPNFFSSGAGFLTGPDAQGLAVRPEIAQAIPAGDPHRAVKAFLNEHASLMGYGAEALNGARISREHTGAHNGLHTVVWQQELNGLAVFDGILMAHVTQRGELVNLFSEWVPDANAAAISGLKGGAPAAAVPRLAAAEAIVSAAATSAKRSPPPR